MVRNGIDNIDKYEHLFSDKRIGLITNPTGVNRELVSTIDIINNKYNLVSLFSPEHGVRGDIQAGDKVETYIDNVTGKKVYSLYGETKRISKEQLEEIDALVFDIQDVGARFYTYLYTLTYAMEACSEYDKEIIVLDRINPLGRKIEGNRLDIKFSSFVGKYKLPTRYGLTIGEVANFVNKEYKINCKLSIVPVSNWESNLYYDKTDLIWIPPSPNIPTIDSALAYIGTCLFEGTNLSEGRGTTKPFEVIGAPWLNTIEIINRVNNYDIKGVRLRQTYFKPSFSKYKDELCEGIAIHVVDRDEFKPYYLGVVLVYEISKLHCDKFKWLDSINNRYFIDLLFGNNLLRNGMEINGLISKAKQDEQSFREEIKKYYLY